MILSTIHGRPSVLRRRVLLFPALQILLFLFLYDPPRDRQTFSSYLRTLFPVLPSTIPPHDDSRCLKFLVGASYHKSIAYPPCPCPTKARPLLVPAPAPPPVPRGISCCPWFTNYCCVKSCDRTHVGKITCVSYGQKDRQYNNTDTLPPMEQSKTCRSNDDSSAQ